MINAVSVIPPTTDELHSEGRPKCLYIHVPKLDTTASGESGV